MYNMHSITKSVDVTGSHVLPIAIDPKLVYGIRSEITGNIHFNVQQEVIYPVEGVLAFHDYVKNKQRFLKLPPNTTPAIITLNSSRQLMAVVELTYNEEQPSVCNIVIYDINTFKKQRSFQLPAHMQNKQITRISFTCDSNAVVALTEYPDEMLFMFSFDRLGTINEGRAGNTNHRGMASYLSCNPQNPDLIAVCGDGVLKIIMKSEKGLSLCNDIKSDFTATSIAWISPEMFVIGAEQGILILFENGVQKGTFRAKHVEAINLTGESDQEEQMQQEEPPELPGRVKKSQAVVCMTAFPKGLAYAIFNQVYVFEKISSTKYERKTIIDIPPGSYPELTYQIANIAINTKQDTVIVTPKHNQIYVGVLIVPESLKTKKLEFKTLGELIHIDSISDICVCSWRPIVLTSSKDKTIRVWNYQTEKVELVKYFSMEINAIALFPSGQYVAIGFVDKVKVMQIFMDDLNLVKSYNFSNSKDIKFSYFGHLMAVAYENCIAISSFFNLETLKTFKGHTAPVTTIAFARNDKSIFSGGEDGALFQWDIITGARLQEIIHPGTKYNALCVPNIPGCFYAATESGFIKEIMNSNVKCEVKIPVKSSVLDIALSRSDMIMFAATKSGHLFNVHLPITGGPNFTIYFFFDSAITKLRFSHDGTLLISCSASGTLEIWKLRNIEGKVAPIDQDLLKSQEVLIPRNELEGKLERIQGLEIRLKQQAAEFYKKQTQNEENEQEQIAETHKGYCEALAEMKTKNDELAVRHASELVQITSQIDELHDEHKIQMDTMAAQYSERMLMEYQKFANLRESMMKIRDSYEEKLRESKACLHDTAEALEHDFKKQLDERHELIRQLLKEMDDKKLEFHEYCRQVEIDNDRKMIDCQIGYEKTVKFERDETQKWKDQADSYKLKLENITKETENLLEEVTKLKDQHYKNKAQIADLLNDIKDLHKDVADREEAIRVKERRIDQILKKNQELEKYKQVLHHKINELKAQIEPRELQIVEKRKQITEMEQELNGLHKNNLQLELQLKELKDKCISANVELKIERARAKSARLAIQDISTEIYQVAGNLSRPDKLREGIKHLFCKYSSDDALKKFVTIDTQIQAVLQKQRAHIEKLMMGCRQKMEQKSYLGKPKKLIQENKILMDEIEEIRLQNENMKTDIKNMGILVKIIKSTKPIKDPKPRDTVVEIERIKKYFNESIITLQDNIKALTEENDKLNEEIESRKQMLHRSSHSFTD